jgi:hypothetical protein
MCGTLSLQMVAVRQPSWSVTHYGVQQPNLWSRVICYMAARIDIIVPYGPNLIGLITASINEPLDTE